MLWPEYKRQAEIYQWLLRKNGLNVSNRSFFVYAIADNTVDRFLNHSLEFALCVVEYEGNDNWIEGTLEKIHQCLQLRISDKLPEPGPTCDFCKYRAAFRQNIMANPQHKWPPHYHTNAVTRTRLPPRQRSLS